MTTPTPTMTPEEEAAWAAQNKARWPSERKRPCPDCGAPMAHTSKRCKRCARNRAGRATFPKARKAPMPETACTCALQRPERGVEHEASCSRHAHRWVLPPEAGLDEREHLMRCVCGVEKVYRAEAPNLKAQQHRRLERMRRAEEVEA